MKREAPRDVALSVLNRLARRDSGGLARQGPFPGPYLNDIFRQNPHLDQRDRAFISQLVQGVLRWRLRLDWIIGQASHFPLRKIDPGVLNILRLALFQILFLDRVPESAAVNEAVNQARVHNTRHVVSFVNAMLRGICRGKEKTPYPDRRKDPIHYLSVFYSYPPWIVHKWIRELGESSAEALLKAGNRIPGMTLRTNTTKITRVKLLQRLQDEGLAVRPTPYSPEGILLEGLRGRISDQPSFREGLFQVQDEAAQITSHLLRPRAPQGVLDLCAGFGGKTTHLAEIMDNRGWILALDINLKRLINLGESCRRLGLDGIHRVVGDATKSLPSLIHRRFDSILVDAPCSGLGVLSRHPDGKWHRDEEEIQRLSALQGTLLSEAFPLLEKGGKMLYVTCTISGEENEGVVEAFLHRHKEAYLENLKHPMPSWGRELIDEKGFFRIFPHLHSMDGFFAALFTRR